MSADTSSTNLKTLKEIILDEQRIITYMTVCKELCLHVNESKVILGQVVKDIRKNVPDTVLNVNYLISGLLENNRARISVCSEENISSEKESFKKVFFEHIYSVSQGKTPVDTNAFVSLNNFEDLSLCKGLIKNSSCLKRTPDELSKLKFNGQGPVDEPNNRVSIKKDTSNKNGLTTVKKIQENEVIVKTEKISPKKETPNLTNVINDSKAKKGIAGFFSKANNTSSKPIKETKIKTEIAQQDLKNGNNKDCKLETMEVDEEPPPVKEITKKKSKNSSLTQIKKNAKVDKKRKRVLCVSDSESDNDPFADEPAENHNSDDEIPPTPTVATVKLTPGILHPKKRRKVVDKTYTDEEGYIWTRKEEVYESCSDNEEVNVKENIESANKIVDKPTTNEAKAKVKVEISPKEKKNNKKISPPQKGKQATMMNFFKKV